tara:strand:- start:301 stop:951 length:651 start_codon:yes stop_codon:yes gene_type:complete
MQYILTRWSGRKVILGENVIDPTKPIQLLLGFHGAESTPENMLIHGNLLKLNNTVMAFPEGFIDLEEGRFSWWEDGPKQNKTIKDFLENCDHLIDHANEHFQKKHPGQDIHISIWGFSQGASAALIYALFGNCDTWKIASICGFLPELPHVPPNKKNRAKVFGIFGSNDEVVPAFLAEHALDVMKSYGYDSTILQTSQSHEIIEANLDELTGFFKP